MNKIITISREFGSGGRELGKQLAEILGIAYYDNEIITMIASRSGLAEEYVNNVIEKSPVTYYPITTGRTLNAAIAPLSDLNVTIYAEQRNIIKELASKNDCLIVGRCADYILKEFNPFNIFVYANINARLHRCRQNALQEDTLSDAELTKKILTIDKNRAKYYKFFSEQKWGEKENYDLCLNTSNAIIKDIALPLSELFKTIWAAEKQTP